MTQRGHFLTLGPNSSKVRLKGVDALGDTVTDSLFQFQWGAIEGDTELKLLLSEADFNSSEVRLKVDEGDSIHVGIILFQFQWGAIEGIYPASRCQASEWFQFQWGAIEGSSPPRRWSRPLRFQFQWGAIEGFGLPITIGIPRWFQFQWGAIEGRFLLPSVARATGISIPVRCDWRTGSSSGLMYRAKISIPVRCDWRSEGIGKECQTKHDFNSSEVRLKASPIVIPLIAFEEFQFQWGAIEGSRLADFPAFPPRFQFQWGAIEGNDFCTG